MSNREAFGKGGGSKSFIKDRKLKAPEKGENMSHLIGRIVPPMKSLAKDKKGWARYVRYHYGHKGSGYKPGTTFSKTFACVEEVKWGEDKERTIAKHCPKCDEMYPHDAEMKRQKALQEAAGGKGKDAKIDKAYDAEDEWLYANSLSVGHKMYIVTPEDEIIRLQLSSRAKKNLDVFIDECEKDGVDVMDIDHGVYIDFRRTGYGSETQDTFALAKKKMDVAGVGKVDVNIPAPLSDEMLDRIIAECVDLTQTETVLKVEEIQELVDCDQDPSTVDAIFTKAEKRCKAESAAAKEQEQSASRQPETQQKPAAKPENESPIDRPKPATKPQPAPAEHPKSGTTSSTQKASQPAQERPASQPKAAEDPEAALKAQIAALQAQLAAKTTPKSEPEQSKPFETTEAEFFGEFPEGQRE